jgi:hypothetical protein
MVGRPSANCPDELLEELNGAGDYTMITTLLRRHRAQPAVASIVSGNIRMVGETSPAR